MPRRLLAVLVVAAVALAVLTLPAAGQAAPAVAIDTFRTQRPGGCANPGDNFDLVAGGTTNQTNVTLTLYSPSGVFLTSGSGTASSGRWSANFVFNYAATGLYEVRATAGKPAAISSAWLEVPCQPPTLEYDPPCFTPGVTPQVTMTVRHFAPYGTGYLYYDVGGSEAQNRIRIPADGHGVFAATFKVNPSDRDHPGEGSNASSAGSGTVRANATWSPCPPAPTTTEPPSTTAPPVTISVPTGPTTTVKSTTTTSVVVPPITPGAVLTVNPKVGPPGFVAQAIGTGFPAGQVELVWTPGIGHTTATAGPDGAFTTQVLVFPKDRIGPRILVATGAGGASANAPFLVVPPTVQPTSGADVLQITRTRRFTQR